MKIRNAVLAGLSLIGVFFAFPSLAATQTYSTKVSTNYSWIDGGTDFGNGSERFSLPTFDSSLGTLTGVRYLLSQTETLALVVQTNNDSFTDTVTVGGAFYFFRGDYAPGMFESFQNVIERDLTLSITPYSQGQVVLSFQTELFEPTPPLPDWFGEFVTNGPGSLTFGMFSFTRFEYSDYGDAWVFAASRFDADIAIEYSYIPAVPEPETYAMLLVGLGLIGAMARRGKQKLNA